MTSALIGALRVSLGLDSSQFEQGSKRARSIAQRDAAAIQRSLAGIKGSLNGLVAGATIGALTAAAKRALDFAGGLGEVSQQLGVTTRDLQVYRYIASQVGVEQDTMDASLAKLTRTMGQAADGSKAQVEAFRDLGIAIKDANGKLYTAGEILPRLADAFARIKDPTTRARLEAELFGRAGQKLDPLLTQGAKGIQAMTKRAEELGLVLGDDLIKSADNASDRLAEMQKQLEYDFARAAANSADAIVGLANAFASLTSQALNFINHYPRLTATLTGAAIGSRAGLPGLLAGATGGLIAGNEFAKQQDDSNTNVQFRAKALKGSLAAWRDAKRGGTPLTDPGGKVGAGSAAAQAAREESAWKEVERQWGLFNQAKAAGTKEGTKPLPPPGDLPTASGGKKKKGPKDRTEELAERFNKELAGLEDEQLGLQMEITADIREKARLEHLRIDTAQAAYNDDVDSRRRQGELTAAQADALKKAYALNAERENTLVNWKLDDELTEQDLDVTRARLENANELLRGELDGARTQVERRRIQLAILDHEQAMERAALEAVIAKHDSTEVEKEIAQAKLDQLDRETTQRAGAIRRDTMGPMESWLDSLPHTADDLKERFESIKVDALNNGLELASRNVLKLKGVAGDLFNQLIADVIRLNLQKALTSGGGLLADIGKLLGMASAARGGSGSIPGSAGGMNMSGWDGSIPGLATGGSFMVGGNPGIDRNVLAVNGIPRVRVSGTEMVHVVPTGRSPVARIEIVEHEGFAARVVSIAGDVSIKTVGKAAATAARQQRQSLR